MVIGAYVSRLRKVVADKRALVRQSREVLGDARGAEAAAIREKLDALGSAYDRFAELFDMLPPMDGPLDLAAILDALPRAAIEAIAAVTRKALGLVTRAKK